MSRQTEKIFKEIEKAIKENSEAVEDKEQMQSIINAINARSGQINSEPDVFDYLEMAENAPTDKKALEYLKKALELEPENTDALALQAEISCKSPDEMEAKYCELIQRAEKELTDEGFFDEENIGEFWLMSETRPYMRLLDKLAQLYSSCGKMHMTVKIYEKMLHLCANDNLGVRYPLMHVYVFFEDEAAAVSLFEKFPDEGTQFLLPMSVLYYKLGDTEKAEKYLTELCDINKDTYKFFRSAITGSQPKGLSDQSFGYRPDTIDELIMEMQGNTFLFLTTAGFFPWAEKVSKQAKTAKSTKAAKSADTAKSAKSTNTAKSDKSAETKPGRKKKAKPEQS